MDFQKITNTGSLWVLHLQPQMFHGVKLDYFCSRNTVICGIGQIIGGGGMTERSHSGIFLLLVEYGNTVSGYSWCQICTNPTQNDNRMSLFTVPCYL